jgi:hypothetical protein
MLNLLPYLLRQPHRMYCPSIVFPEREPYRQPGYGGAGDHLCQHSTYLASPPGVAGMRGTGRQEAGLRVWEQRSVLPGLDWATRRTARYGLESPGFIRGEGQSDFPV